MKTYTQKYMTFFNYDISDFMPCEYSGYKAVDIMHIYPKGKYPELKEDIFNLMAGTREVHNTEEVNRLKLLECHLEFMLNNQPKKTLVLLNSLTTEHTLFNQINEALNNIRQTELNKYYNERKI